uniref:Condensin complex subunit 2 n=1 Tax=Glossina austeni TaxID=7395 RepID=A0A1A9UDM5_GLOAU
MHAQKSREYPEEENLESSNSSSMDNKTLQKDFKICDNKNFSKNAWSVSLIDTFSTLLDEDHKTVNNFEEIANLLEATSKIYSLRVDSIHSDVLRMSAALNAQNDETQVQNVDDEG